MGWSDEWPAEHTQLLRELVADGCSYGMITKVFAAKLQVVISRSAVGGKIKRLGISTGEKPKKRLPQFDKPLLTAEERRRRREAHIKRQRERRQQARAAAHQPKPQAPTPVKLALVSAPVDLSDHPSLSEVRAAGGCVWPSGDTPNMTFCGCPRDPSDPNDNYCLEHHRRSVRLLAAE